MASRIGLDITTKSLSVLGAVVSSGDFIFSLLTSSPNRESLEQVGTFIEGKCEAYRVDLALLHHWLELASADAEGGAGEEAGPRGEFSPAGDAAGDVEGGDGASGVHGGSGSGELASEQPPASLTPERRDSSLSRDEADELLRRAVMEAVTSPFRAEGAGRT